MQAPGSYYVQQPQPAAGVVVGYPPQQPMGYAPQPPQPPQPGMYYVQQPMMMPQQGQPPKYGNHPPPGTL